MALSPQTSKDSYQAHVFCCQHCQHEERERRLHRPGPAVSAGGQTGTCLMH